MLRELTFPLVPRRRLVGLAFGAMHSARRGTGSDVAGSRPYRAGDNVDTIDWNASARLSSARNQDEFIVRERFADEAPRVVLVCDRRPEMTLFPPEFPWLSKRAAMRAAGELIAASAVASRGYVGYLDLANVDHPVESERSSEPFWRPPNSQTQLWRVTDSHLSYPNFHAPHDNVTRALQFLMELRGAIPAGTFIFVLSDFLPPLQSQVWMTALERRWDLVPVVIQDPVWEQTFPSIGSVVVPLADATGGGVRAVRLTAREAEARRERHERRRAALIADFNTLGVDPVCLSTSDAEAVYRQFSGWVDQRLYNRRRGW